MSIPSFPKPAFERKKSGDDKKRTEDRPSFGGQRKKFTRREDLPNDRRNDRPSPPRGERPVRFRDSAPRQVEEQEFSTDSAGEDLGLSVLPGVKPVLELLQQNPERIDCVYLRKGRHGSDTDLILDLCRQGKIKFSLLDPESFGKAFPGKTQGVAARLYPTGFADLDELFDQVMDAPLPLLVFLDQVQDPGNAGTLARTLYAMGGAGLVIPRHNGVYLGSAAAKASAGALERLPVAKAGNLGQALDAADKCGFTIYGASGIPFAGAGKAPEAGEGPVNVLDIFETTPRFPAVLVLGGEESGLRPTTAKRCHHMVGIPMLRDFDSLNVAQAGAVIISWFARMVGKR